MTVKYDFRNNQEQEFPAMLIVGTTEACNAVCIHCPHPVVIATKEHTAGLMMPWDIYKKIANEAVNYQTLFRFSAFGEPLMHPQAVEMVEYAKKIGMQNVSLNTNGSLLTKDKATGLLKTGINIIEFSLDAFSKETYSRIRKGLDYETVINNLNTLISLRNSLNSKTGIIVSMIEQPENRHEIKQFKEFWNKEVDKVIIRSYLSYNGIVDRDKEGRPYHKQRIPCPYAWRRMSVDIFGNIRICIDDWLDKGIVGNIKDTGIHDIWTNSIGNGWREAHLAGEFYKIPKCRDCTDWKFHSWEINYFTALDEIRSKRGTI